MKTLLALMCVMALAACASNPSNPGTAQGSKSEPAQTLAQGDTGPRMVCKREKPIGSKRVVKTCRTREEWDDQARRTQSAMMGNMGGSGGCVDCGGSDGGGQ